MRKTLVFLLILTLLIPQLALAQADFNPQFIISDQELFDSAGWQVGDIQNFLQAKGSYLSNYVCQDVNGTTKPASQIIYDASQTYQVNPKYLLVTLQKEQSLITDDSPSDKQLNWATGYAVCDSCSMEDPKVMKHKGFGKQVDDAAGVMRWYNDNKDKSYLKQKDVATTIDDILVTPQSWATAFLYTYTPHLHGNQNFWRIWQTWFSQNYPDGTLVRTTATSTDIWLLQNGIKRKFKNMSVLISRADPKMIVTLPESELTNYKDGTDISLPNYSILKTSSGKYYLTDYDYIRPFATSDVVGKLGYNPDETIDVNDSDLTGYKIGPEISASSTAPTGVIYQITDLNNKYYLLKDNAFYPITDPGIVAANYPGIKIEKHKKKELLTYPINYITTEIKNGLLLQDKDSSVIYVMENGKKRQIADEDTFVAMGYKKTNVVPVAIQTLMSIPDGDHIYLNSSLVSSKNKFLGDSEAPVADQYGTKLPAYLVAEYPSGRILSGKNIDTKRSIASLTKLITALELFSQQYKPDSTITYNKKKYDIEGGALALKNGEKIYAKDAFNTMLVGSANNAARMIAMSVGLSEAEYIKAMNRDLETWGMDNTKVTDVTGLDEDNKSTSRDLLKIFVKAVKNDKIKISIEQTTYVFKEVLNKDKVKTHTIANTNKIIGQSGRSYKILASKTGYTIEAGSNLIMLIERKNDKKQFVIITLGNSDYKNRFVEPGKIAQWVSTHDVKVASASN